MSIYPFLKKIILRKWQNKLEHLGTKMSINLPIEKDTPSRRAYCPLHFWGWTSINLFRNIFLTFGNFTKPYIWTSFWKFYQIKHMFRTTFLMVAYLMLTILLRVPIGHYPLSALPSHDQVVLSDGFLHSSHQVVSPNLVLFEESPHKIYGLS